MQDFVDVVGASGARYRFTRLREGRPLSPMGGNFLYGRLAGGRLEVVFTGQARNLLQEAHARWEEAQARFQASELYSRLNIADRIRRQEMEDIVEALRPAMNAAVADAPAAEGPPL